MDALVARGERVGVLKVRLFRPFPGDALLAALPKTVRAIAVLDRTKEPGASGEPLYQDVVTTLAEAAADGRLPFAAMPRIVGGRFGLSSKEFTPAMVKAVFDNLAAARPRNHFTIGIVDDVTHTSLDYDEDAFTTPTADVTTAVFYGLGADGTVGANKNSIKIIGGETDLYVQGYFVYDSKKSGAMTVSHLRTSPRPIRSAYLIRDARVRRLPPVRVPRPHRRPRAGGSRRRLPAERTRRSPATVWDRLPREVQQQIIERQLKVYTIDAAAVAQQAGMGGRINTVMQTCYFAISGVLPRDEAIAQIKHAIEKTYAKRGPEVVKRNFDAVDQTLARLHDMDVPAAVTASRTRPPIVSEKAPDFVQRVTAVLMAGKGDLLPVSAFPIDGTWPVGTTKWEKRNIAQSIPVWDETICIQCNQCALVCPHSAIRAKVCQSDALAGAPETFKSTAYKGKEFGGPRAYLLQVAPEDCTGCNLCVNVCPAKDRTNPRHKALEMAPQLPLRDAERANFDFFLQLPEITASDLVKVDHKFSQFLEPLFEFSGACSGCGETPYIKLLTQLFGDRLLIANATGCSSIYGGNLPTTPYITNADGRGPAWANSLFEDNAEFGLGLRLAVDSQAQAARNLVTALADTLPGTLAHDLLNADQSTDAGRARPARTGGGAEARHRSAAPAGDDAAARGGRLPGEEERVAGRWRRLGLRHRLRRSRSRHRQPSRRQHPGARHRGLLQHGRPGLEGDTARRRGEVRGGRQDGTEEGPRAARQHVRPCLRRPHCDGREDAADRAGAARSGSLSGAVDHHRLQSLHRARLRHGARRRSAEARGRLRASGRCIATTRDAWRRVSRRCIWTTVRSRGASATTCGTRRASASSSGRIRRASGASCSDSQKAAEQRYAVYHQMAGITVPNVEPAPDVAPIPTTDSDE